MTESGTSNIETQFHKKSHKGVYEDYRTVGIGAQILNDIGVRKMNLMSAPKKISWHQCFLDLKSELNM